MNREIKFRAWDKERKEMFNDIDFHRPMTLNSHIKELQEYGYILLQYTGLKDKNGKEIYEGDILKMNSDGFNKTIGWRDDLFGWNLKKEDHLSIVIGNVYENKELLK